MRCAFESLALKYRKTLEAHESVVGHRLDPLHIVGGGAKNKLLNQFAANAIGRTVIAGPVEATAIGNVLVQAVALGELASLAEARSVVRASFDVAVYESQEADRWSETYVRWSALSL
jgi:rhamnulokinase